MMGNKRSLVTLETMTEGAADSFGEPTRTYTTLGTAWAQIVPLRPNERLLASQIDAQITHRIEIGWASEFAALSPKDRVTYDGRTFDIVGVVDPQDNNRELHLTVLERSL